MAKLDAFYCKKNILILNYLKIDKKINKINGRNICICLNEIVVRADIHL